MFKGIVRQHGKNRKMIRAIQGVMVTIMLLLMKKLIMIDDVACVTEGVQNQSSNQAINQKMKELAFEPKR